MYSVCKVLFLSNGDLLMEKKVKRKRNYCMVKKEKENKTVSINLG